MILLPLVSMIVRSKNASVASNKMQPVAFIWYANKSLISLETKGDRFNIQWRNLGKMSDQFGRDDTPLFRTRSGYIGFQQYLPNGLVLVSPDGNRAKNQFIGKGENRFHYDPATDRIYGFQDPLLDQDHPIVVYSRIRNKWAPVRKYPPPWVPYFQNHFGGGFINTVISPNDAYFGGIICATSDDGSFAYPFVESLHTGKMLLPKSGALYYGIKKTLPGENNDVAGTSSIYFHTTPPTLFFSKDCKNLYILGNGDGAATAYGIDSSRERLTWSPSFPINIVENKQGNQLNLPYYNQNDLTQIWYDEAGLGALNCPSVSGANLFILRETKGHILVAYAIKTMKDFTDWQFVYNYKTKELAGCHIDDQHPRHVLVTIDKLESKRFKEVFHKVIVLPKPLENFGQLIMIPADGSQLINTDMSYDNN